MESPSMSLAAQLDHWFDPKVRQRGAEYFESNSVYLDWRDETSAEFTVYGSDYYDVDIDWSKPGAVEMSCSCPYFEDHDICKHLWAALLKLDAEAAEMGGVATSLASSNGDAKSQSWYSQLAHLLRLSSQIGTPQNTSSASTALASSRRVWYVLELDPSSIALDILLFQQQRKQTGEWGAIKPLSVNNKNFDQLDAPGDAAVVRMLLGNPLAGEIYDLPSWYRPSGNQGLNGTRPTRVEVVAPLYDSLLPAVAATGRFCWAISPEQGLDDLHMLAWDGGPAWQFRLNATPLAEEEVWRLTGELFRGDEVKSLNEAVFWYQSGLIMWTDSLARCVPPRDDRWLSFLWQNSAVDIPFADRDKLLAELYRTGEAPSITGDDRLAIESRTATPQGRLVVLAPKGQQGRQNQTSLLTAAVSFKYPGRELHWLSDVQAWPGDESVGDKESDGDTTSHADQGKPSAIWTRDAAAEVELTKRLSDLGMVPEPPTFYREPASGNLQFSARMLGTVVKDLLDEGWEVEAEGARIRQSQGVSISIKSGIDWFDLEGTADFDGQEVALPELLSALKNGERYIQLGDGTQGLLPDDWLAKYAPIADLSTARDGKNLRFQPGQALLLDSLLSVREADADIAVDRQFTALRNRLKSFKGVKPAKAPLGFQGELRDYQKDGLGWLLFLEKFYFGGCLADDMGLGKTIQVLALLAGRHRRGARDAERRPSLVVAPKSLVYNWQLEAERFAPNLSVCDYTGTDRKLRDDDFSAYDVIITTYGTLRKDAVVLGEQPWDYVILDEAQAIKNPSSQSAKASRVLQSRHRLALSGTPVENHLGELWSIFEFLNPGMLGRSESLKRLSRGSTDDQEWIDSLRRGLAPFLLRRTKAEVLPQLPQKTEQHLYCELPPAQRKQYNQVRDHYRATLDKTIADKGLAKAKIHVLEALLRLRQVACHPGLVDKKQKSKPSAKLDLLVEQLTEIIDEGHKALIFSQFTSMLDLVKPRLAKAGITYEYLDGKTRDRQARVERFQNDDSVQAFLISLKAGGSGLNLTAADYVFVLDPWWNPAVEAQAVDRAHRIGQERPVFAYRLIARDTVEEKIMELQARKSDLASAIISGDGSLLKQLSADDLSMLLS